MVKARFPRFQFTRRGRSFRNADGAEFARIVEDRDRELEDYLDAVTDSVLSGLRILGRVPTEADLPATGQPGDGWLTDDPPDHLWVWTEPPGEWVSVSGGSTGGGGGGGSGAKFISESVVVPANPGVSYSSVDVTFPEPFDAIPNVTMTVQSGSAVYAEAANTTTTGFTCSIRKTMGSGIERDYSVWYQATDDSTISHFGGGGGGGLPGGGELGQLLRKDSSTDGDATWDFQVIEGSAATPPADLGVGQLLYDPNSSGTGPEVPWQDIPLDPDGAWVSQGTWPIFQWRQVGSEVQLRGTMQIGREVVNGDEVVIAASTGSPLPLPYGVTNMIGLCSATGIGDFIVNWRVNTTNLRLMLPGWGQTIPSGAWVTMADMRYWTA